MKEEVVDAQEQKKNEASVNNSVVLIANPTSGSYIFSALQLKDVLRNLRKQGWQAELKLTRAAGDARRFAHEAVQQKIGMVVAIGGDGTINEVIQELAGSETILGVLPGGTINVWAREVGIPLDSIGACDVLLHGQVRRIDLGRVNDRYFLLMAGIGLDGEVTHAVERRPAKRLGILAYLLVATWFGLGYSGFRARLTLDGRKIKANALQIIIGNTQLYAGAFKYTWQAKCDDGMLDVCIVRKQGIFRRLLMILHFILRREERRQWVHYEKCKEVQVQTRQPVGIQIDGDPAGYTSTSDSPTTISIVPAALKVIVPQKTQTELFSQPFSALPVQSA
jgi:diacylglycerol kinase (ATP)